jgi:trehalose 2-sulfotransferase
LKLEEIFPDFAALRANDFNGIACNAPAIMIAITPRTGSTHLCRALHLAGQRAEPNEIFNARGNEAYPHGPVGMECARRGVSLFADYIASFARGPDPVFIFKTGWFDAAPLAPVLTSLFPALRVIYLDRRNIAAQAVSEFRAAISGTWHLRPGEAAPPFDPAGKFNLAQILSIIDRLEREKQSWESWFAAQKITPLRLDYRQIDSDINAVLRLIATDMNLPLRTGLPPGTGMKKLGDEVSAEWTEKVQKHIFNLS